MIRSYDIDLSDYMQWLIETFDGEDYQCLFKHLMTIPFRYSVQLDANLIPCVRDLRDKMGKDYDGPKGRATVLEILCALAVECEDHIMHNDKYGNRTAQWFWIMLYNLGINTYDDTHYNNRTAEDVDDKVDIFLDRAYDYYGEGSIFVVNRPYQDMRVAPLWEQMNWYLSENYFDEFKMDW